MSIDNFSAPKCSTPCFKGEGLDNFLITLRGQLSKYEPVVLYVDRSQIPFANWGNTSRLTSVGFSNARHVPLIGSSIVIIRNTDEIVAAINEFNILCEKHLGTCSERINSREAIPMALPKLILVPGLGTVAVHRIYHQARMLAEVASRYYRTLLKRLNSQHQVESVIDSDPFNIESGSFGCKSRDVNNFAQDFEGRVVIITGAASGIGRAVVHDLVRHGAHLALVDKNANGLASVVSNLPSEKVIHVSGDLTDQGVVDELIHLTIQKFGGFDGLVCSAGSPCVIGNISELTQEEWSNSVEVNTRVHFLITQKTLKMFERQGIGGSIVYIVSKRSLAPSDGFSLYSIAKAAELQLARVTAIEGGRIGVRANVINPGPILEDTNFWSPELIANRARAHGIPEEMLSDYYAQRSLLGKKVTTQKVAEAATFLLSSRSSSTTGGIIPVDGGLVSAFPR